MANSMDRRQFLQVSAVGGGGMLIGFSLFGCKPNGAEQAPEAAKAVASQEPTPTSTPTPTPAGPADLNAWLRIDGDGSITVIVSESEMGQGVLTALPMIVAEELDADWSKVRSEHAPADRTKYGNQGTGGSTSVRMGFEGLRKAGASARAMLVAAAAETWGVPASECRTEASAVVHDKSGKRAGYGELAAKAVAMKPPESPKLKERSEFRIIGKPMKRLDTAIKTSGEAQFGMDIKRPGMLIAQVAHSPTFGGKVKAFDASKAEAVSGVRKVVQVPSGVAVVADHFWAAQKGRAALSIEWDPGTGAQVSSASITKNAKAAAAKGKDARKDGDAAGVLARAKRKVEAVYEVPYLAHTPMEPLNCTVDIGKDGCEIWTGTQSPTRVQDTAAEITGLPVDKIAVHTLFLGGGFGRRSQRDFIADAVHTAKAVGKPVQVVWTREDDVRGGFYRPMAYNEMVGAVDQDGWPEAWVHRIASPSILRPMGRKLPNGIDPTSIEGAANLPYKIANVHVTCADTEAPISVWFWRSVGSSQNAYVTECFLDELAALGGKDPLEVRLRLLSEHPRHKRVVELAAEKAGWGGSLPEGRSRGLAVHESFGSIVAQVAEVSIDKGAVKVHRVVCAVDCGEVINPNTIEAQMDSGIAYGLSAALYNKIDIDKGRAVQGNFHDYKAVRMAEMPQVETHLAAKGDAIGGIGEPGTPPIAPAVCNALRTLTGKPVRKLPISLT